MKKTCTNPTCHNRGKLGLAVLSWRWRLYCGVKCKETHRKAIYEEARRRSAVFTLFFR